MSMKNKETESAAPTEPTKEQKIQALKATAYDILAERERLDNLLRQVNANLVELQKPSPGVG